MTIYYINYLNKGKKELELEELKREIKEGETLIIGRKEYFACLLIEYERKIIEEKVLRVNLYVSRYNPEIKKFGSLHIKLNEENKVELTVPAQATNDVYVNEVITRPTRLPKRKHILKPNSSITIELYENSALDLYIGAEEDSLYVGSIERR
jgi:hypothetical protein